MLLEKTSMAPSPPPPLKEEKKKKKKKNSLSFFFVAVVALFCETIQASNCNQTCNSTTVFYPFGFSPGCGIQLNCSDAGEAQLAGFYISNITADRILLAIPPACNRSIAVADRFFGPQYAATWRNLLFMRGCRDSASSKCQIDTDIVTRQMNQTTTCGSKNDDLNCFSGTKMQGFMSPESFAVGQCQYYFGSVLYSLDSLVFQTAELEWWLNGACQCSANAECTRVNTTVAGGTGFRCSCLDGFAGDGYAAGIGCMKVHNSRCNSSCRSTIKLGIIIGGILLVVSLMFASAYIIYRIRSHSTFRRIQGTTRQMLCDTSRAVDIYSFKDIKHATGNFSVTHRLGTGADGTVYVGKFHNNKLAAVKRLRHRETDHLNQVINEIKLISSVSHPNLVHLLGCCIELSERILVYEFIPNGTLYQHLHGQRGQGLPWPTRVLIAAESAKAIAYLHTAVQPPIFHRDIKSSNILLDDEFHPKIADFGLSRTGVTAELSHISTAPQGTPGYVDPQYHQNFHLTDKSDVYSFGVVLVELITAMKVLDFGRAAAEASLATLAVDRIGKGLLEEIVDPLLTADDGYGWTKYSIRKVAELAFQCLAFDKDVRPSMVEVAEELEKIRVELFDKMSSEELVELQGKLKSGSSAAMEEVKLNSPISVQEPWISEQSSSWSTSSEQCKSLVHS